MNIHQQLVVMRSAAAEIAQRIAALEATGDLDTRTRSMNPNEPLRSYRRSPISSKASAYRFTVAVTKTGSQLEQRQSLTRTVAGLNELDAEIRMRQQLRKEGWFIRTVIGMELVK